MSEHAPEPEQPARAFSDDEATSRLIVDSIPGLVALLSPAGAVQFVNHRIVEYTGRSLEDLKDWGTNGTVHPDDLPHVIDVFGRSIASGTPYEIVQRLRRGDGVYRFRTTGFLFAAPPATSFGGVCC
jgi:PAS domain S-box-containing protein